ncbi:MAG: calcium-translocating P-type ATPase, SERCA-type [Candidatus Omnitrophica bacterium]|nr:calcium-translocating P-type ATPase, SERCA-type [Candidatus Omnitrophota bacterium]
MTQHWHAASIEEIVQVLSTGLSRGLSASEASQRLLRDGPNELKEKKGPTAFGIFLDQFKDFIIWVLIGAAAVSGFLKEWIDALAIIAIVILNAILGFIQEYRAEKALAALKKLSAPRAKIIRDGAVRFVPSREVVVGDLLELEAGDHVPADARITVSYVLKAQEAALTGESLPVEKRPDPAPENASLGDRFSMVYQGTILTSGKGRAVAVATGMQTELGKIAELVQTVEEETTPLKERLEKFGKILVYICFGIVAVVFFLGLWRKGDPLELFLTAVSLAVAAIPEGLPAVVTISLALGVQRMVKRNALIRKLPSVETLGSATVICSDKTGTLTKNEMTVRAMVVGQKLLTVSGRGYAPEGKYHHGETEVSPKEFSDVELLLRIGILCNSAHLQKKGNDWEVIGDPTEGALLTVAAKAGLWKKELEEAFPLVAEIPFDSERKKMSVIRKEEEGLVVFVKGAPDIVLKECTHWMIDGEARPLKEEDREAILNKNAELATQALRVLMIAYRRISELPRRIEPQMIEKDLVYVGLLAMMDPPREEVKRAVSDCVEAGIRSVMITGDHPNTASAIAKELGILRGGEEVLTGAQLDTLSQEALESKVKNISVYARVSAEHKLRIVKAWKKQGAIVAMTGDGVNDAPAVKEAHIGVAMGITGTDVTKEASDMVVTDDNFASIVAAVEEGRAIFENIKKFVFYLLSCNAGEVLTMFVAALLGWPLPLFPIHILWVNIATDGLPALALGVDPVEPGLMKRRSTTELITPTFLRRMVGIGSLIALSTLLGFAFVLWIEKEDLGRARTFAFGVLVLSQLFHSLNCRSERLSIFTLGLFSNMKLIGAILISFILQNIIVYFPWAWPVFKTEPLSMLDWGIMVAVSSLPLWGMEIVKALPRAGSSRRSLE